jgi:hypothetical protein
MESIGYPERTNSDGVRVAQMNVWGRRGAWDERRRVLVDGFRRLRPDLVSFVEPIKTDDYDMVTDILGPGYHVAYQKDREAHRQDGSEDGQGVSIASRWPLGEVDLDVTPAPATSPTRPSSRRSSRPIRSARCSSSATTARGS